jgi:Kef-type K+ transport system membrane component KefB
MDGILFLGRPFGSRCTGPRNWVPASPPTVCRGIGICAYVALSVLGAILRETGLLGCRMGSLALAIAGIHDALFWILLGLLLWGPAGQTSEGPGVFASLIVLPGYLAVMVTTLTGARNWSASSEKSP